MATKTKYMIDTINWSKPCSPEDMRKKCDDTIATLELQATQIKDVIGKVLYIIDTEQLYELDSDVTINSTAKYAEKYYGYKKSSVSEYLKAYKRFGSRKGIAEEYANYDISKLVKMVPYNDDELEYAGVKPSDTRGQIVEKLTRLKNVRMIADKYALENDVNYLNCKTLEESEAYANSVIQEDVEEHESSTDEQVDNPKQDKEEKVLELEVPEYSECTDEQIENVKDFIYMFSNHMFNMLTAREHAFNGAQITLKYDKIYSGCDYTECFDYKVVE